MYVTDDITESNQNVGLVCGGLCVAGASAILPGLLGGLFGGGGGGESPELPPSVEFTPRPQSPQQYPQQLAPQPPVYMQAPPPQKKEDNTMIIVAVILAVVVMLVLVMSKGSGSRYRPPRAYY
jgi:hypothetical protein